MRTSDTLWVYEWTENGVWFRKTHKTAERRRKQEIKTCWIITPNFFPVFPPHACVTSSAYSAVFHNNTDSSCFDLGQALKSRATRSWSTVLIFHHGFCDAKCAATDDKCDSFTFCKLCPPPRLPPTTRFVITVHGSAIKRNVIPSRHPLCWITVLISRAPRWSCFALFSLNYSVNRGFFGGGFPLIHANTHCCCSVAVNIMRWSRGWGD